MGSKKNSTKFIAVLCAVSVILLAATVGYVWIKKRGLVEESADVQKDAQESLLAADIPDQESGKGQKDRDNLENAAENGSGKIPESSSSDPSLESAAGTTQAPKETKPPYLESLRGLAAGTVLSPEQIDADNLDSYFMSWDIEQGDNLYARINGKSFRENDYVPLSSLCYLKLVHYNFDGQIQVGELVVSKDIREDIFAIFKELFAQQYQIESMYLIDNYWTGDPDTTDTASIEENNTSAFCYREVTGGGHLSNHAYGKAIDLNPQQNPYVSYSSGSPKWSHSNANDYIQRDTGLPHVITHDDLAYKLFKEHGFDWGGDWNNPKDYQHFDKN